VKVGFSVHGFHGRLTTDSEKEHRNLGNSGSANKNGTFYSHEKYMDFRPTSPSIPRRDSTTTRSAQLHSVRPGHQILVDFLAKATGGIRDIITFRYCLPSSHERQTERTIQILVDMPKAYALDFNKAWDDQLALIEFSYKKSYHTSIGMPPFKALY